MKMIFGKEWKGVIKMDFKVGDRVRALGDVDGINLKGKVGIIREVKSSGRYSIEFEEKIEEGHNLNGLCEYGYGRNSYLKDEFELVEKTKPSEIKMDTEEAKNFNPKNLAEGKKLALEKKANFEAKESENIYTKLIDEKEEQERVVKVAKENIKEIDKELSIFK